jgi:hypothetical protein
MPGSMNLPQRDAVLNIIDTLATTYLKGKVRALRLAVIALLSGGHILIEDIQDGSPPSSPCSSFFYVSQASRDNLVGPAVNLLVILLAVRLVSEKSARNYLQMFALSLFSLAGSSLFSLRALFLCYFLLMLTLIAVSLVVLTFHSSAATQAVPASG